MNFPERYPAAPPRVQLCTMIPHPNIFEGYDHNVHRAEAGVWLCLNMLRDASQGSYSGWSGAYSVFSILVQLQSFLFAENVPQDYRGSSSSSRYTAKAPDAAYDFHLDTLSVVTASTCHAQTNFDTILRIYKKISGEVDDNGAPIDPGQEIASLDWSAAAAASHGRCSAAPCLPPQAQLALRPDVAAGLPGLGEAAAR